MRLFLKGALVLCLYSNVGYGQSHPYEVKITSENDNYCLRLHDGYYTNGLFLTFNYAPVQLNKRIGGTSRLSKITSYYQLGQMIFTPGFVSPAMTRDLIDRPFAGYLFFEKGMTFFYQKRHILKTSVSIGTVGRDALAQQTQLFIHKTFDLITPSGWQYQVKNEVGLNLQGQYWHELIPDTWRKKWLNVHSTSQITTGTTFTNASVGFLFQMGRFARTDQSSLYDARIGRQHSSARESTELYVFFQPVYQYQVYNATVEGRLFGDNTGSVVSPIRHWVYRQNIGFIYSPAQWTFQIVYTIKGREAVLMRQPEHYVGLTAAYRLGK